MKKLLALLLCAILALSACAFAEEAPVTHSHRLSNIYFISDDQILDLSALNFELDVSGGEKPDAARLHMDVNGETAVELGIADVDGLFVFHAESETLGHRDYVIDPVAFLANYLNQGVALLSALLQSVDTTAIAQNIMDSVRSAGDARVEAPSEPQQPLSQISIPNISIQGDLMGVLESCAGEPQTVNMGGMEYDPIGGEINIADGVYTVTEFNYDLDTVCQILDMIYIDGQPSGWGDELRDAGIEFSLSGSSTVGQTEGLNQILELSGVIDDGTTRRTVSASYNKSFSESGASSAFSYGLTMDDQAVGLGFTISDCAHEGEPFSTDSIDMQNAISLSDMDNAQALGELGKALTTAGNDALNAMFASLMSGAGAEAEPAD